MKLCVHVLNNQFLIYQRITKQDDEGTYMSEEDLFQFAVFLAIA